MATTRIRRVVTTGLFAALLGSGLAACATPEQDTAPKTLASSVPSASATAPDETVKGHQPAASAPGMSAPTSKMNSEVGEEASETAKQIAAPQRTAAPKTGGPTHAETARKAIDEAKTTALDAKAAAVKAPAAKPAPKSMPAPKKAAPAPHKAAPKAKPAPQSVAKPAPKKSTTTKTQTVTKSAQKKAAPKVTKSKTLTPKKSTAPKKSPASEASAPNKKTTAPKSSGPTQPEVRQKGRAGGTVDMSRKTKPEDLPFGDPNGDFSWKKDKCMGGNGNC